jgi:pimeloyl-ACP methyl ester carboxylesterase
MPSVPSPRAVPAAASPADDVQLVEHAGGRLAYRVRGDGQPVLFIQGVSTIGDAWMPQIDALSGTYACASFDNRGIGRSVPVGAHVTVPQMAEDALAVMDALGWTSAHIVGHSLGGPVAMELAFRAPERVRSLALLCTFANGLDATRLTAYMFWWGLRTRLGTRRQRRHAFLRLVVPPAVLAAGNAEELAEQLGRVFGRDLADTPPIVGAQTAAMRAYDATAKLTQLAKIPTLVVSAKHDPIARPELGHALAHGIPGARYVEIEDGSHAVVVHQAERVNQLLREHLAAAETRVAGR